MNRMGKALAMIAAWLSCDHGQEIGVLLDYGRKGSLTSKV